MAATTRQRRHARNAVHEQSSSHLSETRLELSRRIIRWVKFSPTLGRIGMSVGSAPGVGLGIDEFSRSAHAFLSERAERRSEQGPDDRSARQYSLFRASTVAEADVARAWQPMVSGGGFGWISGPVQYGGRGLPGAYERAYQAVERTCVTPQRPPRAVNDRGPPQQLLRVFLLSGVRSRGHRAIVEFPFGRSGRWPRLRSRAILRPR